MGRWRLVLWPASCAAGKRWHDVAAWSVHRQTRVAYRNAAGMGHTVSWTRRSEACRAGPSRSFGAWSGEWTRSTFVIRCPIRSRIREHRGGSAAGRSGGRVQEQSGAARHHKVLPATLTGAEDSPAIPGQRPCGLPPANSTFRACQAGQPRTSRSWKNKSSAKTAPPSKTASTAAAAGAYPASIAHCTASGAAT